MSEVARILTDLKAGDRHAAAELLLLPPLYDELPTFRTLAGWQSFASRGILSSSALSSLNCWVGISPQARVVFRAAHAAYSRSKRALFAYSASTLRARVGLNSDPKIKLGHDVRTAYEAGQILTLHCRNRNKNA
jgi:hypothetical protein